MMRRMETAPPALLTSTEVAEMFRVSTMTVSRWVAQDRLPAIKIGGTIRFRRADVEALLSTDGSAA